MTDCRIDYFELRRPRSARVVGTVARCSTHPEWMGYADGAPDDDLEIACAGHRLAHADHPAELVARVEALDTRGRCLVVHLDEEQVAGMLSLDDGHTRLAELLEDLRVAARAAEVLACTGDLAEITSVDPAAALEEALAGIAAHPAEASAAVVDRLRAADLHLITARRE